MNRLTLARAYVLLCLLGALIGASWGYLTYPDDDEESLAQSPLALTVARAWLAKQEVAEPNEAE